MPGARRPPSSTTCRDGSMRFIPGADKVCPGQARAVLRKGNAHRDRAGDTKKAFTAESVLRLTSLSGGRSSGWSWIADGLLFQPFLDLRPQSPPGLLFGHRQFGELVRVVHPGQVWASREDVVVAGRGVILLDERQGVEGQRPELVNAAAHPLPINAANTSRATERLVVRDGAVADRGARPGRDREAAAQPIAAVGPRAAVAA